jgi:hypothetical protein
MSNTGPKRRLTMRRNRPSGSTCPYHGITESNSRLALTGSHVWRSDHGHGHEHSGRTVDDPEGILSNNDPHSVTLNVASILAITALGQLREYGVQG